MKPSNGRRVLLSLLAAAGVCFTAPAQMAGANSQAAASIVIFTAGGTFASSPVSGADTLKLAGEPFSITIPVNAAMVPIKTGPNWAVYSPLHMTGQVSSGLLGQTPVDIASAGTSIEQLVGPQYDEFLAAFPVQVVGSSLTITATLQLPTGTIPNQLVHAFAAVPLSPSSGTIVYSDGINSTTLAIETGTLTALTSAGGSGTVAVDATLDGNAWTGAVNYRVSGPSPANGTTVPATFSLTYGTYTVTYESGGPATATLTGITPSATQKFGVNIITFTLNFQSAAPGTVAVNATLDGNDWTGALSYQLSGPTPQTGASVPSTYPGSTSGSYTLIYQSGGPAGATLSGITPSATQTLSTTGAITFTLNFVSPTSGTVNVNATLDGNAWTGTLNYQLSGPSAQTGTGVPATYLSSGDGSYTLTYESGGPPLATLSSITPSANQTLNGAGAITFTLSFQSVPAATVAVNATLDGVAWTGALSYQLSGPSAQTGTSVPSSYGNSTAGSYTLTYQSGAPTAAAFSGITPSDTQTLSGGGAITFTINFQTTISGSLFVSMPPCRVVDTRDATKPSGFGPPFIAGNTARSFALPSGPCGIPSIAQAYSLNVTVVPHGELGYITVWPTGQSRPVVSTLNSLDGRIKANAAIMAAGANGAISVYATNDTDVVLDINGYFVPAAGNSTSALAFYPMTPCRLVDTRPDAPSTIITGELAAGSTTTLPILSSSCHVPSAAQAYSLNFTVVPQADLSYLTVYPTGQSMPLASTLNDLTGTIVANAAIAPAGTAGDINVFVTDATDLVVDINGYFAPVTASELSLNVLPPCRMLDTRNPPFSGPFSGTINTNVLTSGCGVTTAGQAYLFNATVVPAGPFGYLTLWPEGTAQPLVSTLNAIDGDITSNMAIVPTVNTGISAFADDKTFLILDLFGYFAP